MHTTKVCKDFEINVLGEYHDLSIQRDRLLLADVFENFRDMCIEIYEPDAARFFTATGLSWQTAFKKIKIKLNLLADIDILLMIERGRVCQTIEQYENGNSKYIKDYDKNKVYSNGQCHGKYL